MRSMREKIISSDRGSRGMMAYGVTGGDGKGRISHKLLPPQNATFAAYSLEAFEPLYRHARKKNGGKLFSPLQVDDVLLVLTIYVWAYPVLLQ